MPKNTFRDAILLALLILAIAGAEFIDLAQANPGLWLLGFPTDPVKTPPDIRFQSPVNNQVLDSNSLWLNFSIVKPNAWFLTANVQYFGSKNIYIYGNITSVNYTVNGITNGSIPVLDVIALRVEHLPRGILDFSTNLTLPEGNHNLTVTVHWDSFYKGEGFPNYPFNLPLNFSKTIHFTIKTLTEIKVLSPITTSYNSSDVPLNFTVNKIVNSLNYSLDGKNNVGINGNTTITELTNGQHNITVSAIDIFGNVENSETVTFTVAKPEPFLTMPVAIVSGTVTFVACAGVLFFGRKRKR